MLRLIRDRYRTMGEEHAAIVEEYPDFRRNYLLGIINGVFFNTGLSFFNKSTIIPVFLSSLGAPSALIAVTAMFEGIGWHLPQFFAARFVAHKPLKLPFYGISSVLRIAGLVLATVAAWLAMSSHFAALVTYVLGYGLFAIAGGFAGVVFTEVMAKTVPKERRGSYFGWRAIISGLVGLWLGVGVISPIIAAFRYPTHFVVLFAIGCALIAISFYLFVKQKEPYQEDLPEERTFRDQVTRAREILRTDRRFRRLVIFRSMMMLWFSAIPFNMLFARDRLGAGDAEIGLYISWEFAGLITGNLLWGYLSNRVGNKLLMVTSSSLAVVVSASMFLFNGGVFPAWTFGFVFFMVAAIDSGAGNGGLNYALEIVPEAERPTYVGLMNSILAVALSAAVVAGTLRDLFGYIGLFATTAVVSLIAMVLVLRLPEPRHSLSAG